MKKIIFISFLFVALNSYAQRLQIEKIKNSDTRPRIEWYRSGDDSMYSNFKVWRAHIDSKSFDTIATAHFINAKADRVKYIVIDTTLTEKGIYKYFIEVKDKDQNILKSPVALAHNMGYIPKPHLVTISAEKVQDKKAIKLHWKLNHNFSVRSLSLFRSSFGDKNYEKIAELSGKATEYTDMVPLSNHNYYYFILIADYFGYEQPSPIYPAFSLFKQKPIPPQNISITSTDKDVKLQWKNVESNLSGYQVFRKENDGFYPISEVITSNQKEVEFIDNKLPKKAETLDYYVINYSDSYLPSISSDTLSVSFLSAERPLPPEQLDVLVYDNHTAKLIWNLANKANIKGYNVYMEKPEQKKLNTTLIPVSINYFEIENSLKAGSYTFSVESIGFNEQKSLYKTKAAKNIIAPYAKLLVTFQKQKDGLNIKWLQHPNSKIKKILLYKQTGNESSQLVKKFTNTNTGFLDKKVKKNTHYFYTITGVLENGEKVSLNDGIDITY